MRRGVIAALLSVPVLAIVAVVWFLIGPPIGSISGKSLNYSVTKKAGGSTALGVEPCVRRGDDWWTCPVADSSNSGGADYRVRLRGDCWTAQRVAGGFEGRLEKRVNGCVGLRDQVRLVGG